MKKLKEYIAEAKDNKVAIGHFNISDSQGFWAVVKASRELNVPVIIGVSEGERDFIGVRQVVAMVKTVREEYNHPIFINADHTYSFERVKEVVDAGYDAVIFDATEMSFEANVIEAKKCRKYIDMKNPDMILECELGFIGKSSKVLDSIPEGVKISEEFLTTAEDAKRFVQETGADLLAPAVGNIHGMLKGGVDPALNTVRIAEISKSTGVPLVLHGGSGNSADDFRKAIDAGVAIIHVNTELRVAYRQGLSISLQENPDEVAPYKYMKGAVKAMQKVVEEKLKIFNKIQ